VKSKNILKLGYMSETNILSLLNGYTNDTLTPDFHLPVHILKERYHFRVGRTYTQDCITLKGEIHNNFLQIILPILHMVYEILFSNFCFLMN
jgi:hypothetical protein